MIGHRPTPRLEQAQVTDAHLAGAYLPIIREQALTIARLTAHAEALAAELERLGRARSAEIGAPGWTGAEGPPPARTQHPAPSTPSEGGP